MEPKKRTFKYKNPDGTISEYVFVNGSFTGFYHDGVEKKINFKADTLTDKLIENLNSAGFKESNQ